jgi:hypothetical protein
MLEIFMLQIEDKSSRWQKPAASYNDNWVDFLEQ